MIGQLVTLVLALQPVNRVPAEVTSHLTEGANITRWFCYVGSGDHQDHYRTYLTKADYREFARLGYKFVRLCVSPDVIYKEGGINADAIGPLDEAVSTLNRHGLLVIWDLHDNGQLKLDQAGTDTGKFVAFWKAVAEHYKDKEERSVVFELLNEPVFQKNPDDWYALQAKTVSAIRQVDPDRTIMVSPNSWSSIDTLATMKALPETNLLYTFHCYDPFFFTHQGAEWVGEYPGHFKQIPFPATSSAVDAILSANDERYRPALVGYGKAGYDAAYLRERIAKAADWGKQNGVPVVLGEFGAYPKVSPPESRARWFQAMRSAIRDAHVPDGIWGYDDGLGLGRSVGADGAIQLDPVTLKNFYGQ